MRSASFLGYSRLRWHHVIAGLLVAWALGLGVATLRLHQWQQELTEVLNQLRADELLRSSIGQRDQVLPEWYLRRALALMSAVERLPDRATLNVLMPGSWRWFDDLEERAALRIDAAFKEIVVETIRRELDLRAAALSGIGRKPDTGELLAGQDCVAPVSPQRPANIVTGGLEDLPAYGLMLHHLEQARQLDAAAGALTTLLHPGTAQREHLRMLVRYSLGAELSGAAVRSLARFQASANLEKSQAEALVQRLQWAMWCSVAKGVSVIHAQWLERNELLMIEDQLAPMRAATLFAPASKTGLAASLSRLKTTAALIERQHQLLAGGSHEWMRSSSAALGPAHERLLEQVASIRLLGPQAAAALRAQGEAGHAEFQRRFTAHVLRADAGIVWRGPDQRYALSPARAALADGLARLLDQPFMSEQPPASAMREAAFGSTSAAPDHLQELSELVQQRRRFLRDSLPAFPATVRPHVRRYLEDRINQRAFEIGAHFVESRVDSGSALLGPVELTSYRIGQIEAALLDTGSPALARQIRERLQRELLVPVAAAYSRSAPLTWSPPLWSD